MQREVKRVKERGEGQRVRDRERLGQTDIQREVERAKERGERQR